jgi:hypothetical protein
MVRQKINYNSRGFDNLQIEQARDAQCKYKGEYAQVDF